MFYLLTSTLMGFLMRLLTNLEVIGAEHVPLQGPLLIVANHLHFADPPLLAAVIPRKVIFMAKSEVFRKPVLGWAAKAYDAIAVRRGTADRRAIRRAMKALGRGLAVGIFPEGTRSRLGQLQCGKAGAALIALRTGVPILPVAISGTRAFLQWPAILHRPYVSVKIGRPFRLSVNNGALNHELLTDVTDELMIRIAELLPHEQRGVYAEAFASPALTTTRKNAIH